MPPQKIAILGSTGRTGRAIVKNLLESEDESYHLHLLVRSKERLEGLIPGIQLHPRVTIEEGLPNEVAAVKNCLSEASFIVCTIGTNNNEPGIKTIQDTASTIVAALLELKKRAEICGSVHVSRFFPQLRGMISSYRCVLGCCIGRS
ncbi:hypothetical protein N7453_004731 [Penicillium expansum]|nr:hypothetical protein N7453_004731 [Penicillium expansum]